MEIALSLLPRSHFNLYSLVFGAFYTFGDLLPFLNFPATRSGAGECGIKIVTNLFLMVADLICEMDREAET